MVGAPFDIFKRSISSLETIPYGRPRSERKSPATAVTILDAFSMECFSPELTAVPVSRVDYEQALEYYNPEFILVESAWQGNEGAWTYQLVGSQGPRPAFYEFVAAARRRDIPIVFWNKEDPPHFSEFLPVAKEADLVLTTAGELIDEYREAVGHEHVDVLPFAAQPAIHHPFGGIRDRDICFAGQYFAHKYPERRTQMEYLFPAAARHDFTIYSRELGKDPNYAFPAPYDSMVRGSMPYAEMVKAYRDFKIFLNVNSVVDSPTMCARRIFEISASGAVVVSSPSEAIPAFYSSDEVFTPATEDEARDTLSALLDAEDTRRISSHKAWRRTLKHHTYSHRVNKILERLGVSSQATEVRTVLLVDPRGAQQTDLESVLAQISHDPLTFDEAFILDFEEQLGHGVSTQFRSITPESASQFNSGRVIVVSAKACLGANAIPDLSLAIEHYSERGPFAKVPYNANDVPTFSEQVGIAPLLWGAGAGLLSRTRLLNLLYERAGNFDTLDNFNLLDRGRPHPNAQAVWEI